MLAWSLWITLAVAGCLLVTVGVVVLPAGAVLAWICLGLLIGALAWIPAGKRLAALRIPVLGAGPRAGAVAAALTVTSGLVLTGLAALIGTAGAVALAAVLLATAALWIRRGRGLPQDRVITQIPAAAQAEDLPSA